MTWTNRSRRAMATTAAASMLGAGLVAASVKPASAQLGAAEVLADFEAGSPPGFFVYNGASSVSANPITVGESDPLAQPDQIGDNGALEVTYTITDYGGFGQSFEGSGPQDWSNYTSFDFWFKGTGSGQSYLAEISDNRSDPNTDTSERFNAPFEDTTSDWRYVSIPFTDFSRSGGFQPPGAPDDGFTLTEIWAWAIPLPVHADTVYVDDVALGLRVIDDFEDGVAPGGPCAPPEPLGFCTFVGTGSVTIANATTPPAPELPGVGTPNGVLQMDVEATDFAGFIHGFTNSAGDTWVTQDWSTYEGISFWMYGTGSGKQLFVDILDNRNPGSESDDAERFSVPFTDTFTGWQKLEFPFADFVRKEIGNGAPNDGLGLFEMHGYAIGTLDTGGPRTYYVDNVALYGIGEPPALAVNFAQAITPIEEGTTGDVRVKLNRALGPDDPTQVSIDFATERSNATPGIDFTETSGTLTFTNPGPTELTFPVETFDNSKFAGDKQIVIRLTNPVGMERGSLFQGSVMIKDDEKFDPKLLDDFEQGAYLWSSDPEVKLSTQTVKGGGALERPDQDPVEHVLAVATPLIVDFDVMGSTCRSGNGVIPVYVLSTPDFDATRIDHTTVKFGDATETHTSGKKKTPTRHEEDVNDDGLMDLVFHFRANQTGYDCDSTDLALTGKFKDGTSIVGNGDPIAFGRDFPIGQNWTKDAGLSFWYYGTGTGDDVTVTLKDNRAPDPGPTGWTEAWSDEFSDAAGTPPNPANWAYEIGDTTPDGKNGWGNEERQYYTDDPKNAQTDGNGNLVITLDEADGSQECYYGPCEYESARLITQNKAEFAYGRIESRLKVPSGGDGLWPAFWSLGTDITHNPWPNSGEIDVMEYVSRVPNEIFGTIHGPGYSGGGSFGGTYDFGAPVRDDYHTYAVEWEPDEIRWYVDDVLYHTATPADIAPNTWVFEKPFFLLLNFAIGGNFGGAIDPNNTYPQEYLVDYVKVFEGPDTAERFEATFTDSVAGWQRVTVPFTDFVRSADQPAGAPDDGLGLNEVWGYGFELPKGGTATGVVRADLVNVDPKPKPATVTVTNTNDAGDGSLRQALEEVATGGTILFEPALAGDTIALSSPLEPAYDVVVDASDAPGIALDAGGSDRVLMVPGGVDVTVKHLVITNGYGWQLAGGVLNNGSLTLDHATVSGNVMATDAGDFWQGGGGIYSGDGASLTLIDSTVADNTAAWSGGGIYSFFNTATTIIRSTISGNTSADVGGGLRTLGTVTIDNSTISGNTATGWHGGAIFQTDGDVTITNSTIANNVAPDWAPSTLFIGQFGGGFVPTLSLTNTIISGNQWYSCEKFASGTTGNVVSGGHNVFQDDTCNPAAADLVGVDPMLGPLADNGGPTLTHALLAGSPAIDAADGAASPATDQRGVARPQGAGFDIGAFELEPTP
jgi:beta-glucanase (GH16 family)